MNSESLKLELRRSGLLYAKANAIAVDESPVTALLFKNLADSFHPESFSRITSNPFFYARTQKAHPNATGYLEMQSSNSSDALLMNIFCHPKLPTWKGVRELLGMDIDRFTPDFGFKAGLKLKQGGVDDTEIDMVLGDLICEAKLTESDFKQKRSSVVEGYHGIETIFHMESLKKIGSEYGNYQAIRNLLASIQHNKRHLLICDERRPDLVRSYLETVACLRDIQYRSRCGVVFWQEIVAVCGDDLADFLRVKYGMHEGDRPHIQPLQHS